MKAIDRLFQYFEYKGIKPTRLEKDLGLSNGYLGIQFKRKADIGTGVLEVIVNNCRDLNVEWLILGTGEMIKQTYHDVPIHNNMVTEPISKYNSKPQTDESDRIKELQYTIDLQKDIIQGLKNKLLDRDASGAAVADAS